MSAKTDEIESASATWSKDVLVLASALDRCLLDQSRDDCSVEAGALVRSAATTVCFTPSQRAQQCVSRFRKGAGASGVILSSQTIDVKHNNNPKAPASVEEYCAAALDSFKKCVVESTDMEVLKQEQLKLNIVLGSNYWLAGVIDELPPPKLLRKRPSWR